jgi:type III pantothenate kinase
MLLAIDIGNSNVCLGLSKNSSGWMHFWRLPTLQNDMEIYYETQIVDRFLESGVSLGEVDRIILSSVVPDMNTRFVSSLEKLFLRKVILVGPEIYPKIKLDIENPTEIGTDLVANAVAAHHQYKSDCIIVDFGTALTFTTVSKSGVILGVSIVPGLKTAIRALFNKTAQLPEVPMELPASVLGKNTVKAIQTGIFYGYTGLVIHMIQTLKNEVGVHFKVIATGGLSSTIEVLKDHFDAIEPDLTLNGLRYIAEEIGEQK